MSALNLRTNKATSYRFVVLALAVSAGIIHLLLIPEHLAESTEAAIFFAVLGVAQIAFGILFVLQPTKKLVIIGMIGNMGSIILYWITRLASLPEPFGTEDIDAVGIVTKIIEISLVAVLIYLGIHFKKIKFVEA